MAGFALQTSEGELLGFLLLAGPESREAGPNPRDCIFMSIPSHAELVEHELNVFLTEYRATEFQCTLSKTGEVWQATIAINEAVKVQLSCAEGKSGEWAVQHAAQNTLSGLCQLLPATNDQK